MHAWGAPRLRRATSPPRSPMATPPSASWTQWPCLRATASRPWRRRQRSPRFRRGEGRRPFSAQRYFSGPVSGPDATPFQRRSSHSRGVRNPRAGCSRMQPDARRANGTGMGDAPRSLVAMPRPRPSGWVVQGRECGWPPGPSRGPSLQHGRAGQIRTAGLLNPIQARCQAALQPGVKAAATKARAAAAILP